MNVNESGNSRRILVFSVLGIVWLSLVIATTLLIPVTSVLPEGPALDLMKPIFLTVGAAMLSLAMVMVLLMATGWVSVPTVPEGQDLPWPVTLLGAFVFACVFTSSIVIQTADRFGTEAALKQLFMLLAVFILPFVILAIVLPAVVRRYSNTHARRVKVWGYSAAMLIDFGMVLYLSDEVLSILWGGTTGLAVFGIGYLIFVAARAVLRRLRQNAHG